VTAICHVGDGLKFVIDTHMVMSMLFHVIFLLVYFLMGTQWLPCFCLGLFLFPHLGNLMAPLQFLSNFLSTLSSKKFCR
jgi:hypothetical protein